ncbi:MAG: type II toxin-antitoxin system VapC family toxin [Candidatus Helarchaeota archaeon]
MTHKIKVYLDTSVISALFDQRNPERQALTREFFDSLEKIEVYISEITLLEIDHIPNIELKKNINQIVKEFNVLELGKDTEELAQKYVEMGAVPKKFSEDAFHIAVAVMYEMDYLLSWNFKHIVKRKTKDIVRMVNTINGFRHIEIMTPAEFT